MRITWEECGRNYELLIEENNFILEATLRKGNKISPYSLNCPALNIYDKTFCDNDFFVKNNISKREERVELAKEEALKIIKKALKRRENTYEKLTKEDIEKQIAWSSPKPGDVLFYNFSFYHGKTKIMGTLSFFVRHKSYLRIPWMGKYISLDIKNEDEVKEKTYELIIKECYEKLEILKNF